MFGFDAIFFNIIRELFPGIFPGIFPEPSSFRICVFPELLSGK